MQKTTQRYAIRIPKRNGSVAEARACIRRYFESLQQSPYATYLILINTRDHLLFLTTRLHPEDADRVARALEGAEMCPIVCDVGQGYPYVREVYLRVYPKRKTARLPKEATELRDYRWVVYERNGAMEGLLLSDEPATAPTRKSAQGVYIVSYSKDEGLRFTNLIVK